MTIDVQTQRWGQLAGLAPFVWKKAEGKSFNINSKLGNRNAVFSETDNNKWQPIMPDSINQALWQFACAKK